MALTPEDALDLQFLRDARISPDGRRVVYAVSSSSRDDQSDACVLWLLDLETGSRRALTSEEEVCSSPRWSPDGETIAYLRSAPTLALMVLAVDGAEPARAVTDPGSMVVGAPTWSPDGRHIAVAAGHLLQQDETVLRVTSRVYRAEGFGVLDSVSLGICIVDVKETRTRVLVEGTARFQCTDPHWSPRGDRILFSANFDENGGLPGFPTLRCVHVETGKVDDVLGSWGGCQSAAWLPDGERIAFVGAAASSRVMTNMDLWVVGPDGTPERRTAEGAWHVSPRIYQDSPIWDLVLSGGLTIQEPSMHAGVTVQVGGMVEIWDVALEGPIEQTPVVTGERSCILLDAHPRAGRLFVATDMFHPTDLFLDDGTEHQLTHLNEDLISGWPAISVEPLEIAAHDGRALDGWFLKGPGAEGPLPTVMHIHGGPYLAVGHAFRFDFHLLASHGMGVVFSNFRGSAGYGQEHMDAIGSDWGNAGFPDHIATVDAAVSRGWADDTRLGVWGASHGGFATSWIVGHSDRFAAAVAEAAVTDWALEYYTSDVPDAWAIQHGGTPAEMGDLMRERSPLTYASNCVTPILMLHCEGDHRCPLTQAEVFHRAVLDAGCVSEMAVIHGGNHIADAMGPVPVRLAQDEAVLGWFRRHLLPTAG